MSQDPRQIHDASLTQPSRVLDFDPSRQVSHMATSADLSPDTSAEPLPGQP